MHGAKALLLGFACLGAAAGREEWAVLIAGSKGYANYRHQADVCHAHKVLTQRGFDPDKIITMIYDDVANSSQNPFPGKLYNHPAESMAEAVDVYAGCKKDYTGNAVNSKTFLAVLLGDEATAGGKVLGSGPEDHVFVNFVDHGGVGLIAFPSASDTLHAKTLVETIEKMHQKNMYKQLVFYLETCESGSMFQDLLPPELPVYAVTASNARESSWGTYCGDDAVVGGKSLFTCLGDLFEVNWMGDSEQGGNAETLAQQFSRVKVATNRSHVMRYGETKVFSSELVSDFQGPRATALEAVAGEVPAAVAGAVDARLVKLEQLYHIFKTTGSPEAGDALVEEIRERQAVQALAQRLTKQLLAVEEDVAWTRPLLLCHERAVEAFGQNCGWSESRLVLSKALYQLCAASAGEVGPVLDAVGAACGQKGVALWA